MRILCGTVFLFKVRDEACKLLLGVFIPVGKRRCNVFASVFRRRHARFVAELPREMVGVGESELLRDFRNACRCAHEHVPGRVDDFFLYVVAGRYMHVAFYYVAEVISRQIELTCAPGYRRLAVLCRHSARKIVGQQSVQSLSELQVALLAQLCVLTFVKTFAARQQQAYVESKHVALQVVERRTQLGPYARKTVK